MDVMNEVIQVLEEVLSLGGRGADFQRDTALLGSVPELDSMAVVSLITMLEERFNISVDDDEIDGDAFSTIGALVDFVQHKVGA